VIPHVGNDNAASLRVLPRLPSYWKVSNNSHTTATTLEDWHDVVRIAKRIELAVKMGKIEGSAMDSRTVKRWIRRWLSIEKPQLFCLVRSCHNINCSKIFAKIDIPLPLKFVYQHLPDSRFVASTLLNHMQPLFPKWYKPDEMRKSLWAPRPFQLNICKNFNNRDRMMVSKKRVEFVKDDVIDHFVTRTSSE
jgi:hypothetical protein